MSILEQAFTNEVIDTLAARNITIEDSSLIDSIVSDLINEQEDMWDYINTTILRVSASKIMAYLEGTL